MLGDLGKLIIAKGLKSCPKSKNRQIWSHWKYVGTTYLIEALQSNSLESQKSNLCPSFGSPNSWYKFLVCWKLANSVWPVLKYKHFIFIQKLPKK